MQNTVNTGKEPDVCFTAQDYVRKCSTYDPVEHMVSIKYEETDAAPILYLTVPQRLEWMLHWCNEQGHSSRIDESRYEIKENLSLVIATCVIYIDGAEAARATASREYNMANGGREVSNAVQTAFTFAKGRALADLGFGTVNGNAAENGEMFPPESGIPVITAANNPMFCRMTNQTLPAAENPVENPAKGPRTLEDAQNFIVPIGKAKGSRFGEVFATNPGLIDFYLGDAFASKDKYPELIAACRILKNGT